MTKKRSSNSKLKIAISGTHGVGKTTLVNQMAAYYKLPIICEKSRLLHETMNIALNQEADLRTQVLMLLQQIRDEHSHSKSGFIADRSLYDYLAYARFLKRIDAIDDALLEEFQSYIDLRMSKNRYDIIFYLPVCFPLVGDDLRPGDQRYQKKVDKQLRAEYKRASIPVVELPGEGDRKLLCAQQLIRIWYGK